MAQATEDRLARLPQWAQRHVERLERDAASWRSRALAVASDEGTRLELMMVNEAAGLGGFYLPEHTVRFHLDRVERQYVDVGFERRRQEGPPTLALRGGQGIVLAPQAANSALVRVERW